MFDQLLLAFDDRNFATEAWFKFVFAFLSYRFHTHLHLIFKAILTFFKRMCNLLDFERRVFDVFEVFYMGGSGDILMPTVDR